MSRDKSLLLATTGLLAAILPASALAQTTGPTISAPTNSTQANATAETNAAGDQVETVVVTARKRREDVLTVPVAVTAYTNNELLERDIKTTTDLANFTPGLQDNVSAAGGARVDRSSQLFIIRGMNPSNSLNPTTSTFINGVPVASSNFLQNLDDLDHVEVLKGPQSAYFGRETFAGAINAVTAAAGDTANLTGQGEIASRNTYTFSVSGTVPIIQDKLSVRGGFYYDSHDGSYDNRANTNETLGDQTTKAGHLAITAKPFEGLTIKAFGLIEVDDDGPAATGILLANGPAGFNQSNCKIANTNFFCGTLPGIIRTVSPAQTDTLTAAQRAFLSNPGGEIQPSDIVQHFGLKRDAYHVDLNVDYVIPNTGLTLSYLGGFNRDDYSEISDLSNINSSASGQYPGYAGFPFLVEGNDHDYSNELRLASDPSRWIRGLVGLSYLSSFHEAINDSLAGAVIPPAPAGAPSKSRTEGVFFSLGVDFLRQFTLNFDGRYQADREQSLTALRAIAASGTTHDFLPRVSLQYRVLPNIMTYVTYSEGVNPGVFNTQYNSLPGASQAELAASGSAGTLAVQPEHLTNYEIGAKGRFWDGRATFAAAAYYDDWTNQLNANVYYFAANDPANPYNVVGSAFYRPNLNSTYIYSSTNNSASTHAKGFEFEGTVIPIPHLTVSVTGDINDTRYSSYLCTTCAPYPTTLQAGAPSTPGGHLPNSPKYTASLGGTYERSTNLFHASGWYVRGDFIYRDGFYIQATNTVKTPDAEIVNIRGGLNFRGFSVEAFVNNLFNDRAYTAAFQNYNFAGGFAPAVMVGLPQLITGGVRVRFKY